MGYLLLSLAVFANLTKGYCGKKTSSYVVEYKDAAFQNMIRMLLCVVIGFFLLPFQSGLSGLKIDAGLLMVTVLSGIANALFVVFWITSVKKGAYMTINVFVTMGVIVPLILCKIFFGEPVTLIQTAGLLVLILAVVIMCSYNNSIKQKITPVSLLVLTLCGLSNGIADFTQKWYVNKTDAPDIVIFNLYTYLFGFLFLFGMYLIIKLKNRRKGDNMLSEKKMIKETSVYLVILAVSLFLYSYFKTEAALYLTSAQLYPLNQGATLILSAVMSHIFFKEKINMKCAAGIILTFVSLIIINVIK